MSYYMTLKPAYVHFISQVYHESLMSLYHVPLLKQFYSTIPLRIQMLFNGKEIFNNTIHWVKVRVSNVRLWMHSNEVGHLNLHWTQQQNCMVLKCSSIETWVNIFASRMCCIKLPVEMSRQQNFTDNLRMFIDISVLYRIWLWFLLVHRWITPEYKWKQNTSVECFVAENI